MCILLQLKRLKETLYLLIVTSHSPLPQLLASTNLLSISAGLPVLDIHVNGMTQCAFYVWILSLIILFSIFIHVVEWITLHSFFYDWMLFYCMDVTHFVHSFLNWAFFHSLAAVNNAAMNICVHVFVWTAFVFFWVNTEEWNCRIIW